MATAMEQPAVDLREPAGWRRTKNQIATVAMVTAFVVVLIPLGFVLYTVIAKGASAISWSFLTGGPIPPNVAPAGTGGMGPAVYGTLEITGLAAVMAVPLGILGAIYVNEYGGRGPLVRNCQLMAEAPLAITVNSTNPSGMITSANATQISTSAMRFLVRRQPAGSRRSGSCCSATAAIRHPASAGRTVPRSPGRSG